MHALEQKCSILLCIQDLSGVRVIYGREEIVFTDSTRWCDLKERAGCFTLFPSCDPLKARIPLKDGQSQRTACPLHSFFAPFLPPACSPMVWWESDNWHMSQICCLWVDGDFSPPGNIFKPRISLSTLLLRERVLLSLGLQLSEKKRRFIGRKWECICAPYHARQADKRSYMKNYCMWLLVHGCTGSFTSCSHTKLLVSSKKTTGVRDHASGRRCWLCFLCVPFGVKILPVCCI